KHQERSTIPGRMHACGHDFHTAALLGGARLLKVHEVDLNGTVRLIFQPAEEGHRGAKMMIDNGVLAGVRAIVGFHNMPNLPVGTLAISRLNPNGRANKLDAIHIPKTPRTINVTIGIKIPLNMLIVTMFRFAKI
ncbi:hypothetical protein WP50_16685, partial [Lactiplantibacillus plantarum]